MENQAEQIRDRYSRLELLIYTVGWLIIFGLPLFTYLSDLMQGGAPRLVTEHLKETYSVLIPILGLFLLNNFLLLPRLFWNHRKGLYFMLLALLFAVLWAIQVPMTPHHHLPEELINRSHLDMFHLTNLTLECCVLLANFAIKMYIHGMRRDVVMLNIKNERTVAELRSLRYQVNPHFLMNTLNNIQALVEIDPDRACRAIQYLSRMMRYLLYEENSTRDVPLDKEVEFMEHYISLMKLRYPADVEITTAFPLDCRGISVPPLLFISFVENAFKYGISYTEPSRISISITLDEGSLRFRCSNTVARVTANSHNHGFGIGIGNVKRRLDLIYPNRYHLHIGENERVFTVDLTLPIPNHKTLFENDTMHRH